MYLLLKDTSKRTRFVCANGSYFSVPFHLGDNLINDAKLYVHDSTVRLKVPVFPYIIIFLNRPILSSIKSNNENEAFCLFLAHSIHLVVDKTHSFYTLSPLRVGILL